MGRHGIGPRLLSPKLWMSWPKVRVCDNTAPNCMGLDTAKFTLLRGKGWDGWPYPSRWKESFRGHPLSELHSSGQSQQHGSNLWSLMLMMLMLMKMKMKMNMICNLYTWKYRVSVFLLAWLCKKRCVFPRLSLLGAGVWPPAWCLRDLSPPNARLFGKKLGRSSPLVTMGYQRDVNGDVNFGCFFQALDYFSSLL